MLALSLTQPWASLIAIGAKQWETRSWSTGVRGQVAIHAAKNYPRDCRELECEGVFLSALRRALGDRAHALPTASIIAVATITDCRKTEEFFSLGSRGEASRRGVIIGPEEFAFGNFNEGRYAFHVENVLPLSTPIPCRGALNFWRVPDDVTAAIYMQLVDMKHDESVRAEARGEVKRG